MPPPSPPQVFKWKSLPTCDFRLVYHHQAPELHLCSGEGDDVHETLFYHIDTVPRHPALGEPHTPPPPAVPYAHPCADPTQGTDREGDDQSLRIMLPPQTR